MAYNRDSGVNGNMDHDISDLEKEREVLSSNSKCQNALRLVSEEIEKRKGKPSREVPKYSDIVKNKPTRVAIKVVIPTKEHPSFNFVGKLLGPKGSSLKQLQDETLTKMSIKGEGSMRDKRKEDELRAGGEQKYSHLNEELHVEISTTAPVAEAYARIAHALAEIQKYLIPDSNDTISLEQQHMYEMMGPSRPSRGAPGRGAPRGSRGAGRALLSTPGTPARPGMGGVRGPERAMERERGHREYARHGHSMEDPYSIYDSYSPYESYTDSYESHHRDRAYDSYGTYSPDPARYRAPEAKEVAYKFPLSDRSRFRSVPY